MIIVDPIKKGVNYVKSEHYDCIVVGAGPAGSSAAITAAGENMSVLLLERGAYPGAKKLFSGLIHRAPAEEIVPAFWEEAPVERQVVSDELWFLDRTSAVKIGFTGLDFAKPPYNKFTVLRYKWDNWLAHKAIESGAHLITGKTAKIFLYESKGLLQKKIAGIELDSGERIYSNLIILAEGCSAALTEQAGLRGPITPKELSLQVVQLYYMDPRKIEERFNLEKDEGAVIGMIGYSNSGTIGKGGIWVQKDTIALSVGGIFDQMIDGRLNPYHQLSLVREHPLIKRLLAGSKPLEYGSHTIPKGGFGNIPRLYSDNIMVAGDAAGFIIGRRGTDLAMLSGKYAGETAALAHAKGDYSAAILKAYENRLIHSFFYKDMKSSKAGSSYFNTYRDADYIISKSANELAYEFFQVGIETKAEKIKKLKDEAVSIQPLLKSADDLLEGIQHWGFF